MRRSALLLLPLLSIVAQLFGPAHAYVEHTKDPLALASASTDDAGLLASAAFEMQPPGSGHAVSTTAVQSFPTAGDSFAILSTSNTPRPPVRTDRPMRGTSAYDVSVLRIDLNVPASANCLTFDFRFLSMEEAEFGEGSYEDAFIAELNAWTWTTRSTTMRTNDTLWDPDNFALYPSGAPVVAARPPIMTASDAQGTGYSLGTPLLVATAAISGADANGELPGTSSLYLSIFDRDDASFDSAVFVDGLRTFRTAPGACTSGPRMFTTLAATPRYVEDTTIHAGELSARLTDRDENGIAGATIDFHLVVGRAVGERLCSVPTDADGWARCADPDITRDEGYLVRFAGDPVARPSGAWAWRVTVAGTGII